MASMLIFDRSFPSPEENLACDQALFDACEDGNCGDVLRLWQTDVSFVVVGYTNRISTEVYAHACEETGTPILRRFSGGGAVVQGPGCLSYSLILRVDHYPECKTINGTNVFVMKRHRGLLQTLLGETVEFRGTSDLTIRNLKFSGNAQRRGRHSVIYHGTFLLAMDLSMISRLLPSPSKQPEYRRGRSHGEFLTNINLEAASVRTGLQGCWNAHSPLHIDLSGPMQLLVRRRYTNPEWNFKY